MKPLQLQTHVLGWLAVVLVGAAPAGGQVAAANCHGVVRDASGDALAGAAVELQAGEVAAPGEAVGRLAGTFTVGTDASGAFAFPSLPPGSYTVRVRWKRSVAAAVRALTLREGERTTVTLELGTSHGNLTLRWRRAGNSEEGPEGKSSGNEHLSSRQVSDLPLNKRDFTHLLQLAAGTTTDTNGAANFTQQFAINGQRGTTAVFAMDGLDTTDPELGGATFANFNVDAILEIDSESGALPALRGEGAAGFTNVLTKSGTDQVHGSVFEFVRNAAFDARNFFDRRSQATPGRLPPFVRNEFGFTMGGPVVLPGVYDGRHRTFFFGQYQGFRQVLGTTQVLAVPTPVERQGIDATTYPGDTLLVPVNPAIVPVLNGYPLPNDAQGAYGARTYAASSKVATSSNQFSIRIDHRISDKAQLFARFNLDDLNGPPTNPSQTAINPNFVLRFFDHQRNLGLTYTRTLKPNLVWETALGLIRSTPLFTTIDRIQPGLTFADGLYEPFNAASGAHYGAWGNLWQARQSISMVHSSHSIKTGFEARFNRDTTIFAMGPNGTYTFGGGTSYARVALSSSSGTRDIQPGDPLPDALTQFLTGTPYSFTASVAGPQFPQGNRLGLAAVQREAYNAYFQDTWKVTPRFALTYGLRYEVNARIHEGHHLTSAPRIVGPDGKPARFWDPGARQKLLVNPQPPYRMDWRGWGPRLSAEWRATDHTTWRAGGALTTLLPNLFLDNGLTGAIPYVLNPYFTALPDADIPFTGSVIAFKPPPVLTPEGQPVFATPRTTDVPANTEVDLERLEEGLAALSPDHQRQALLVFGMASHFQNGYAGTYSAGFEHSFGDVSVNASYVGSAGVKLVGFIFPNNYGGADPAFAPFTRFNASG